MLFALGAAVIALACVIASARRLAGAVAPIELDPRMVLQALEGDRAAAVVRSLRSALASDQRFAWERDLLTAFEEADERRRDGLVNEQLIELEARLTRSARVPRVCASIATSAGLLFGSLALVQGLGESAPGDVAHGSLSWALGAVSLGIAATTFCVAVHVRAARLVAVRRAAIDELVARLESVTSAAGVESR